MKNWKVLFLLFTLCLAASPAIAQRLDSDSEQKAKVKEKRWSKNQKVKTGQYVSSSPKAVRLLYRLSLDGTFYFGDAEPTSYTDFFKMGMFGEKLGAGLTFSIMQPVHKYVMVRYNIGGGTLRGGNEGLVSDKHKGVVGSFDNFYGKIGAGVMYYPIPKYGLYVYGGLQFNTSFISYQYTPYKDATGQWVYNYTNKPAIGEQITEENKDNFNRYIGLNPQVALKVGYDFKVEEHWSVGVHLGADFNVFDKALTPTMGMSLDAWPCKLGENEAKYPNGGAKFSDGYIFLGVSITYDTMPPTKGRRVAR